MSPTLPQVSRAEVVRPLGRAGFEQVAQRGSHVKLRHPDGPMAWPAAAHRRREQKVLAAHRAGLTEVILPARNEGDLDDVPDAVREQMTFHLASDVRQVLERVEPPAAEALAA